MEKHLQTIMSSVALMILGWVGYNVNSQQISIATLTQRVSMLQDELRTRPALTRDEVIILMSPQREMILDLNARVTNTEKRVGKIENDLYVQYPNPRKRVE